MADNKIKFNITSGFDGKGFAEASSEIRRISGNVKNIGGSLSGVTSALGEVGGKFGEVGGKVSAFGDVVGKVMAGAQGGIAGLAIAAATAVTGWLVKWDESMREARKKHREFLDAMKEGHERRLAVYAAKAKAAVMDALQASIDKGKMAIERINALAGAYRNLSSSVQAQNAAKASLATAGVNLDYERAINGAASDEEKDRAKIDADRRREEINYKAKLKNASEALAVASDAVAGYSEKVTAQQKIIDDLNAQQREDASWRYGDTPEEKKKRQAAMDKRAKDIEREELKLQQMTYELASARNNLKTIETQNRQLEVEHLTELERLKNAEKALAKKTEEAALAREREIEALDEAATKGIRDREIRDAQRNGEAALRKNEAAKKAIEDAARIRGEARKMQNEGMALDQARHRGISGEGYSYDVTKDGNIRSFREWQRASRYRRNEEQAEAGRQERASRRNEDAEKQVDAALAKQKAGKRLSRREQQMVRDWDDFNNAKGNADNDTKRLRELAEESKEISKSTKEAIEAIKAKFEDLGVK